MVLFALCRIASLLIGLSVLAACSHDIGLMKMDEQTNLYGSAIRWGAFQRALEFHEFVPKPPPDPRFLQNIKVTGYQTLFQDLKDDRRKLLQTVEIRYVRLDDLVERNFTQEQTWLYDEKKDQWRLWSDFPKFR